MIARSLAGLAVSVALAGSCSAQVYSPAVLKAGQVDASSLQSLVAGIYRNADAKTPREKAEAIWRFFLTDGRFVKPGFWYHIAGWAYEEPLGEVLDPVKLLNSYGFGLCYHVAPLLEAVWEAGGFESARVWFLTGHTVAEVFYDGAYHYFDSDMMGYNPVGAGPVKQRRVASVHDIERDGNIILGKSSGPRQVNLEAVDSPWYPADVRGNAIGGLASLFTTTGDNWVFPFRRYPRGHSMDFTLRPGERITRYFHPEAERLYYLPYQFDGNTWSEFPREISEYKIRTGDGPRSQKDFRFWATGKIEYRPTVADQNAARGVFAMASPYVVIDAQFAVTAKLPAARDRVTVETSVDGGRIWTKGGTLNGPFEGVWDTGPAVIATSEHGKLTAVTGSYGYQVRFTPESAIRDPFLTTRFQLNPRTLPALTAGRNAMTFRASNENRTELPIRAERIANFASKVVNAEYVNSGAQGYLANRGGDPADIYFELSAPEGAEISGFDAGGRFLDLREGLAPDKFTAEVRKVAAWPAQNAAAQAASIAWSSAPGGPFTSVWNYDAKLKWKDGEPIDRTLRWPEVDLHVGPLPAGTRRIFVRYRIQGIAIDDFRLAVVRSGLHSACAARITHNWKENGANRTALERIDVDGREKSYAIEIPEGAAVTNQSMSMECVSTTIDAKRALNDVAPDTDPASDFWRAATPVVAANDNYGNPVPGHRTEIRARWTKDNLYFLFTCPYEKLSLKPDPVTAAETNELWNWDVAEVFIGSDFENIRRYQEFEISPRGEWIDLDINLDHAHPADGWTWNSGFQVQSRIDSSTKIWYGALRIPYAAIDSRTAAAGNTFRVNFYRGQGPEPEHKEIAWQPTMNRSFHVPTSFGTLKLIE